MASLLRSTLRPTPFTTTFTHTLRKFSASPAQQNMAKMTLIGRLAAAPEVAQSPTTGQTYYRYAIGTSHGPTNARETSWFNVSAFPSETQEGLVRLMEGLDKGTLVFVEAEGSMRSIPLGEGAGVGGAGGQGQGTRKVLRLVQRNIQVLSRPANRTSSDAAGAEGMDGAYVESAAGSG